MLKFSKKNNECDNSKERSKHLNKNGLTLGEAEESPNAEEYLKLLIQEEKLEFKRARKALAIAIPIGFLAPVTATLLTQFTAARIIILLQYSNPNFLYAALGLSLLYSVALMAIFVFIYFNRLEAGSREFIEAYKKKIGLSGPSIVETKSWEALSDIPQQIFQRRNATEEEYFHNTKSLKRAKAQVIVAAAVNVTGLLVVNSTIIALMLTNFMGNPTLNQQLLSGGFLMTKSVTLEVQAGLWPILYTTTGIILICSLILAIITIKRAMSCCNKFENTIEELKERNDAVKANNLTQEEEISDNLVEVNLVAPLVYLAADL